MRIPVVDVQEPVIFLPVPFEPVERQGGDVMRRFQPTLPGIVDFTPAGVPPPGRMPLPEGADRHRAEAEAFQGGDPAGAIVVIAETAPGTFDERVSGSPPMVDHAGVNTEEPAPQRRARWQAGHVRGVAVFETGTLGGDPVDVGAGIAMVAVAAQVVGTQGVDVDEEDAQLYTSIYLINNR